MKGTCVNKPAAKCFENKTQSLHSKGKPVPADKADKNRAEHGKTRGRRRANACRRPRVLSWKALFMSTFDLYLQEWDSPFE